MQKVLFVLFSAVFCSIVFPTALKAQTGAENSFRPLQILAEFPRPTKIVQRQKSAQIKGIQVFGERSGVAFTSDALYRTDDNGDTWREIVLTRDSNEIISGVGFKDERIGYVILADQQNASLQLAKTQDGGISWAEATINLKFEDLSQADLTESAIYHDDNGIAGIKIRLVSSSNFDRSVFYQTSDGGNSWERAEEMKQRESEETFETLKDFFERFEKAIPEWVKTEGNIPSENIVKDFGSNSHAGFIVHSRWYLTQRGSCEGFKTGCVQETKVYLDTTTHRDQKVFFSVREITPPQIKQLAEREKFNAKLEAENSVFAARLPNNAVRTSLNRGFDKCTAATVAQMQTWWDNSPFYDANIYMSGRNRGCAQPQLTASWVAQVSAMGWGLIPTIVGYQSPCTVSTTSAKLSYDPATAEQQGRGEADIAATDANNLGLAPGTVLYYDMERYDETANTPGCRTATKAFLKGWTDRIKELGYISGVYGSPTNAVADWIDLPQASRMDAIWMARWDNNPSVWSYASPSPVMPTNVWNNRQRIKQYQAPHNETWGGVTFNIDGNSAEGPVAGVAAAKNKPADFDGDGKTDISIFRPDSGSWFVLRSSNGGFSGIGFGASADILAPGDYDGDGKTDYAVFRPSDGAWYIQNRIFRSQQFGAAGDVPVPADYNGDGFTDIAVFRPSSGAWYIWNSSGSPNPLRVEQFGAAGDIPVPGDYDGDGKADPAVFRPSDGVWYLLRSQLGFTGIQFGIASDKPVQADYDGDGKTDPGVYRDGNWYLLRSQLGFTGVQFGIAADKPSPGDFDGDGKIDVAVFREGVWYILQSQNGFNSVQFGIAADRTIPSAYVPQN